MIPSPVKLAAAKPIVGEAVSRTSRQVLSSLVVKSSLIEGNGVSKSSSGMEQGSGRSVGGGRKSGAQSGVNASSSSSSGKEKGKESKEKEPKKESKWANKPRVADGTVNFSWRTPESVKKAIEEEMRGREEMEERKRTHMRTKEEKTTLLGKSIFDPELKKAKTAKEIMTLAASTRANFTPADSVAFLRHLIKLGKVKRSGVDFREFLYKVEGCLPMCDAATIRLLLVKFADLKSVNGLLVVLPHFQQKIDQMTCFDLVECIWSLAIVHPEGNRSQFILDMIARLHGTGPLLSNLMLYHLIFGLAKLDFKGKQSQSLFLEMATTIRQRLAKEPRDAFPPIYLVRMCWSYGRLHLRDPNLFAAFSKSIQLVVDELEYQELKTVKHVYETMEFFDKPLLFRLESAMGDYREIGGEENPQSGPRKKGYVNRVKRPAIHDPIVDMKRKLRNAKERQKKLKSKLKKQEYENIFGTDK